MSPTVHIVPHTHWDREWYHPAARFQVRLARVVDQAMALIERGRLPVFLLDGQSIVLDDYLLLRPGERDRLRGHLEEGRLECGPWYVLADNFLVSGEALVRNLIEGGKAVRRSGGKSMTVGYAPDTFGHPAILPSLFAGFGIRNAVTWRGFGGERGQEKDLYLWEGPDGADVVMIHLPPQGYENGANLPADPAPARERWTKLRAVLEKRAASPHWLVLNGADHHAPQPDLREAVKALEALAPDCQFTIGPLGAYAAKAESWGRARQDDLPRLVGELRHGRRSQWVLQGTHSARLYLKQANAKCQRLLERVAEPLTSLALVTSHQRPATSHQPDLDAAWRTLLENHPHDSICGTSSDDVHREMMTRFARCAQMTDEIVQRAFDAVADHDPGAARVAGRVAWKPAVLVFNPSAAPRESVIIADVALFKADVRVGQQGAAGDKLGMRQPGELVIRDADGRALEVQELGRAQGFDRLESDRYYPDCDAVEWRRVAITSPELPSLGVIALPVEERSTQDPRPRTQDPVGVSEHGLANEHVWLRIESDGSMAMVERASGRSVHGLGGIECMEDQGDSYTGSPRGRNLTGEPDSVAVRVLHAGPLVGELEVVRRWDAADLLVIMRVRLDAGARHVELGFHFVNNDGARRVRAVFPLRHPLSSVVADGPFGPVERSPWPVRRKAREIEAPEPSAPMLRYVSVAGVKDALTVFSDGLPQYEAKADGTLFVTLLRSFTQLSRGDLPERPGNAGWPTPTPEGACLGAVHARLAVMLHDPEWLDERRAIEDAADAFLSPPMCVMRRALLHVPRGVAGPSLEGAGLVFSAMKPAESGKGVILRCYNDGSETVRGAWCVGRAFTTAMRCRLDETALDRIEVKRGRVEFEAGPREIVTIQVR